jgi:hypothetical protein
MIVACLPAVPCATAKALAVPTSRESQSFVDGARSKAGRQASGHFLFHRPLTLASDTEHNLQGVLWCYPRHAFFEPLPDPGKGRSHMRKPWIILFYGLLNDPTFGCYNGVILNSCTNNFT